MEGIVTNPTYFLSDFQSFELECLTAALVLYMH